MNAPNTARAFEQIPVSVLQQHTGKWIVWDQDDKKVIGATY